MKKQKHYVGLLLAMILITACGAQEKTKSETVAVQKQESTTVQSSKEEATQAETVQTGAEAAEQTKAGQMGVEAAEQGQLSFSAVTLGGEQVDGSIFADYDLTVINIWATWCGWCVKEMPELEVLHGKLPDKVNLISICEDAETEPELAAQMLADNGVSFQSLVANDELREKVLNQIPGFPTTIFVDREGKLVGEPQIGVPQGGESTADAYLKLVEQHLELVQ